MRGRKPNPVQKSVEEIREQNNARKRKQREREKASEVTAQTNDQSKEGKKKEAKVTIFAGIDGEGRNDPTRDYYYEDSEGPCYRISDHKRVSRSEYQAYTLLQSSTSKEDYIENVNGLSSFECLHFLCTLALKYPRVQFVGYGLSYDINMWLRDMTYTHHKYLREWMELDRTQRVGVYENAPTTGQIYHDRDVPHVTCDKWEEKQANLTFLLEWLPKKELTVTCVEVNDDGSPKYEKYLVTKRDSGVKVEARRRVQHGRFQIYDVLGFFGSKFMDALKDMNILESQENMTEEQIKEDKDFLQNMKNARAQFNKYSLEQIREYCYKECVYLVKLMERVAFYCRELGLEMKRWDGAGAIASAMLKKYKVDDHIVALTGGVLDAARHAFSGGRIELVRYGHIEGKEMTYAQTIPHIERKYKMQIKDATIKLKGVERKECVDKVVGSILTNYYKLFFVREDKRYSEEGALIWLSKELKIGNNPDKLTKEEKDSLKKYFSQYFEHMTAEIVVWDYDVNSAYPTSIKDLPSFKGGEWRLEKEVKTQLACCHVRWVLYELDDKNPVRIFPFFYRKESGMIIYPEQGENWIWGPEYAAYLKYADKYGGVVELLEVYNFYPATDEKPFAFVDEIANKRLEWKALYNKTDKKEGGQHIIAKLGLNSLYGKTAQQIGWHFDEDGNTVLPPFHNLAYAGYITSFCRAKVYDAAMTNPQAVLMFATDGLFVTEPLDHLKLSANLGDWEKTTVSKFTALQSGVYFSDSGSKQSAKTRGFEAGSITEEMVLDAWNNGVPLPSIDPKTGEEKVSVWVVRGNTHKFVTIRSLLTSHALWDRDEMIDWLSSSSKSKSAWLKKIKELDKKNKHRFCCWEDVPREQSLSPLNTKRQADDIQSPYNNKKWNAAKMLLPTIPAIDEKWRYGDISKKYELLWVVDPKDLTDFEKNERQMTDDTEEYLEQE